MKIQIVLIAAALLAGCTKDANTDENAAPLATTAAANDATSAQPASTADMNMDPAERQKMAEDAASMGMSPEAPAAMRMGAGKTDTAATTEATGVGVVKSIDAAGGTVTIAHEPIAALNWPAMTMGFNASPALLDSIKEGDSVDFEFTQADGKSTLTVLKSGK